MMLRLISVATCLIALLGSVVATVTPAETYASSLPSTGNYCDTTSCSNLVLGYYKGTNQNPSKTADMDYGSYVPGTPLAPAGVTGNSAWSLAATTDTTKEACCTKCGKTQGCTYWQFFDDASKAPVKNTPCYLLSGKAATINNQYYSYLGGHCNVTAASSPPPVTVTSPSPPGWKGDPHFTGWDGVHFDFTGSPGRSYCLLSEPSLHMNMYLDGHTTRENGTKVTHSWIKHVGVVTPGHTLAFYAREGAESERGEGYMKKMVLDGREFKLKSGENLVTKDSKVIVEYVGHQIDGDDDIDVYAVVVEGVLKFLLKLRPEIPLLRIPTNSWVHFSLEVVEESLSTENIHGVLGQTMYNLHHPEDAPTGYPVEYSGVVWAWQVVGPDADNYIQGTPRDYVSSHLLASDCKFSRFSRKSLFGNGLALGCWRKGFVC